MAPSPTPSARARPTRLPRRVRRSRLVLFLSIACQLTTAGALAQERPEAEELSLAPAVERALADPLTPPADRRAMLIFHGQWDRLDQPTPAEQAQISLASGDWGNVLLSQDAAPALLRARAAILRGEPALALEALAQAQDSIESQRLRAEALELLGRLPEAVALLEALAARLEKSPPDAPGDVVACTRAMVHLARLSGRPSEEYHRAMRALGQVRTRMDRLHWPATLAEAELLLEKFNRPDAVKALLETLRLNPRCDQAWYALGSLYIAVFEFDKAEHAAARIKALHPQHPLARCLLARSAMHHKDYEGALLTLRAGLEHYPQHRELRALEIAALALMHDAPALAEALKAHDVRFPGDALPQLEAGAALSFARQYNESRAMLSEAIRRRPNWSAPRVELGLMLMQQGDEQAAFTELTRAVALDPFNTRAINQHKLAQQLLAYEVIRTKHFVIKCRAGIDQVLARDIAREVEALSDEVTAAFQHRPANPTIIELLPDASAFAVRITGIPELWTIAACTGDVVAMAPPREGAGLKGRFDWYTVLRHEYTHTVTLDQTANRIPHWLTEACAVSQEPPGRDYDTARLLAHSLHENELFDLKSINWAFVRPRRPNDRQLAYAQAAWMLEFLVESHGREALIRLLRLCKENPDVQETLQRATGRTPADFMTAFRQWAAQRVLAWGLGPTPADPLLHAAIKAGRLPEEQLAELLRKHPGQPDLLRLRAEALLAGADPAAARAAVLEHQKARPVDPWSHKALVQLADRAGDLEPVIDSLRELDRGAGASGAYANQIADLHRAKGRLDLASDALRRALHREPFHAGYREQIAAIELQRGDAQAALFHLQALPLLEPKRALHHLRIAALSKRLGQDAQADAAARRAIELDAGLQSQARAFLMN